MRNKKIDPKMNKTLEELRIVPPRDPEAAARGKANFLKQAAGMRAAVSRKQEYRHNGWIHTLFPAFPRKERTPVFNTLMAVILAVAVFFGGAATTVYAAQDSLPNQSLYPVKTWSEDTLLSLTGSPLTRLNYELDFTDRRIAEMTSLAAAGTPIPERVITRLQNELDQALELAAGLEDIQMLQQLEQILLRAETQLQTMNALMAGAPASDQPVLLQAHARIQEQVRLCALGETDPGGFRLQIRQRQQYRGGSGIGTPGLENEPQLHGGTPMPALNGPQTPGGTPMPTGNGYGPGPGNGLHNPDGTPVPTGSNSSNPGGNQPSGTPGQYGPGPQSTPQSGGSGHGP
jgi:hypothetical protein